METKTINVNARELAELVIDGTDKAGSPDWSICANINDGSVDLRHNTYDSTDWIELCNMYNGIDDEWLGKDDDDYSHESAIDFLISDTLPSWFNHEIDNGDMIEVDGGYEPVNYKIQLTQTEAE